MTQPNPYTPPETDIENIQNDGVDETSPLSPAGRFTRLSYLGWTMLLGLIYFGVQLVVGGVIAGTSGATQEPGPEAAVAGIFALVVVVVMVVFSFIFAIRRCHDFNASGWWSLLVIVPLANLAFYFIPGTQGGNRFGPMRPTRTWEKVLGIGMLVVAFVGGILAAIAIPAYMDYMQRAQEAGEQMGAILSLLPVA